MTYGNVLNLAIEKSKGKADVFVDYAPHVSVIHICIYCNGWDREGTKERTEKRFDLEKIIPQACIDFINNTLSDDTAEEHY